MVCFFRSIKHPKTSGGDLTYYVFSFEDVVAHMSVTENPGADGILVIKVKHLDQNGKSLKVSSKQQQTNFMVLRSHKIFSCITL